MSANFLFTGKITIPIFTGQNVPLTNIPDPVSNPITDTTPGDVIIRRIIYSSPIVWDSIPANLEGLNLTQITNTIDTFANLVVTPNIVITSGQQGFDSFDTPTIYFVLYDENNPISYSPGLPNFTQKSDGNWATVNNNGIIGFNSSINNSVFANSDEMLMTINVWNNCNSGFEACGSEQSVNNFIMNLVLNVNLTIICTGLGLTTEICTSLCENTDNLKNGVCFKDYLDFCFITAPGATGPILFSNGGDNSCNTYFEKYLGQQGPGPNVDLDEKLTESCAFITGFDELIDNQPVNIQNICACHLNPTLYENLEKSITSLPGGQAIDEPAPCLFPPCVNTAYKTNSIGKTCPLPVCINIADIQNDGSLSGGATINQSCTQSNTIEKYLIILVPVGIIVLFVIIVILFLVFREI